MFYVLLHNCDVFEDRFFEANVETHFVWNNFKHIQQYLQINCRNTKYVICSVDLDWDKDTMSIDNSEERIFTRHKIPLVFPRRINISRAMCRKINIFTWKEISV